MGDRITCQPRRFKIGDKCAIEVKEQVAMANVLIGDVAGDQETSDGETVLLKHVMGGKIFTAMIFVKSFFTKAAESTAKSAATGQ